MVKNKLKNGEVVWKDNILKDMGIWFWSALALLFLIALIIVWNQGLINRIGMGAFLIFYLYYFFLHITSTKVTLYSDKILTANMIKIKLGVYKIKQKSICVIWDNIKNIRFENYLVGGSWVKNPRPFLVIHTKDGKKYIYLIHDIPSFIQALKKLGKYNLLSKETREKYKKKEDLNNGRD